MSNQNVIFVESVNQRFDWDLKFALIWQLIDVFDSSETNAEISSFATSFASLKSTTRIDGAELAFSDIIIATNNDIICSSLGLNGSFFVLWSLGSVWPLLSRLHFTLDVLFVHREELLPGLIQFSFLCFFLLGFQGLLQDLILDVERSAVLQIENIGLMSKEVAASHKEFESRFKLCLVEAVVNQLGNFLLRNFGQLFLNFLTFGIAFLFDSHALVIFILIEAISALLLLTREFELFTIDFAYMVDKLGAISDQSTFKSVHDGACLLGKSIRSHDSVDELGPF